MRRKIIALLLAFMTLCSGIALAEDSAVGEVTEQNPISTREFDALSAMGFLPDEFLTIDGATPITRSQFAGALCALMNYKGAMADIQLPFIDVDESTPYRKEIACLYQMNIVNGDENSFFYPNEKITYAEAIKMAVTLLGYGVYAEKAYGAYPVGYILTANRIDLTDGIDDKDYYYSISAEETIQLLYNAAITPIVEGVKFKNDNVIDYDTDSERYILSVYHNIYFDSGIMSNNGLVSIDNEGVVLKRVKIGNILLEKGDADYTSYLGENLDFFYYKDTGSDIGKLIWAAPNDYNNTLTINSQDLEVDDEDYSFTKIVYWKNSKRKTANVHAYADIVYNNDICNNATLEQIKPKSGNIKLIDNDNNGVYDIVVVTEYENLFAVALSADKKFLLNKYGQPLVFENFDYIKVIRNGEEIPFDEIPNNCIVSYVQSVDKKTIYIYVNEAGITEKLTSISSNGGSIYYTFDSGTYKMASSLEKVISDDFYYVPDIKIGNTYKYYLDIAGEIAEVELIGNGHLQYAYIIDGEPNTDSYAPANSAQLEMILQDGTDTVVYTANKVTILKSNGNTLVGNGMNVLNEAGYPGDITKQVVMVAFNSDGELKEIKFAQPVGGFSAYGYSEDNFTLDYSGTPWYISGNCCLLGGKYSINGNTTCFVRYTLKEGDYEYGVIPFDKIRGEQSYNVKIYDCDRYFEANAMEIEINANQNIKLDGHILVDKVTDIIYKDGEIYKQITGYNYGKLVKYRAYDDVANIDTLKRGDIISIAVFDNKVVDINVVCSLSENPSASRSGNPGDEECRIFGPLYANNGRIIVTEEPAGSSYGMLMATSAWGTNQNMVTVYDARTDKITIGSVNGTQPLYSPEKNGYIALTENIKVFIFRRYNYVKELIVAYY